MADPKFHKLTPRAIRVWQIGNGIGNLFLLAIPVGYLFIFGYESFHLWVVVLLTLLTGSFWISSFTWFPYKIWRNWHYCVDEKEIDLKRGVIFKTRTLIPLSRVQHVDTRQGPLLRWLGLSSVFISTAATTHEIPALDSVIADRVRKKISTFARLAEDDV